MSRGLLTRVGGVVAAFAAAHAFDWWTSGPAGAIQPGATALLAQFTLHTLVPWIALTPVILELNRRVPPTRARLARFLLVHGGVLVSFIVASTLPHMLVFHVSGEGAFGRVLWIIASSLVLNLPHNAAFYAAVLSVRQTLTTLEELKRKDVAEARLSASLADARLGVLKAKLQPHFLFNALHSINVLVLEQRIDAASEMLERLGHLLRLSLDDNDAQLVPLSQELATLEHYLAVEQIRFADRLRVTLRIAPETRQAVVPNLVLQPLVENAVKHGLARSRSAGRIVITARRAGPQLELEVWNDGPGLSDDWQQATERGIGLATTVKRLELLFPGTHRFDMRNAAEGGVAATVTMPWIDAAEPAARP